MLTSLPYDAARAGKGSSGKPDPKRYRDGKQLYQTAGLLFEDESGQVRLTALGDATRRWVDKITEKNMPILGRHAAYGLAACQLRNPTGAGSKYDASIEVFPFAFVWRAMLALDGRINSDELNRAIFKVRSAKDLGPAVASILAARKAGTPKPMGPETITGPSNDDRIIPWMSIASFGWTLIADKKTSGSGGYYTIRERAVRVVEEAASVRHRHREFADVPQYVSNIAACAALPPDLR